ncbi:MAG: Maf family protein [Oscillochloridaceae bacterium umkhey_bin13]
MLNQPVRLVLASASPRRRELLAALGATFTVITTDAEESQDPVPAAIVDRLLPIPVPTLQHPTLLAWRKANAVALHTPDAIVLGADTVVALEGQILNKPADDAEAHLMLRTLAGRTHTVYTGLCLIRPDQPAPILDLVAADVVFTPQSDEAIAAYVATGEPRDKAGAYGIQGMGGRLVHEVRGSYTAVVGLPLPATYQLLSAAGISGLQDPAATFQHWLRSQGKEPPPWPTTSP